MNRRRFLTTTGALGVAGLAGCLADANDTSNDTSGDETTPTPTPGNGDASSDESSQPTVTDATIELVDAGCNDGQDSTASVSMDEETLTVSFTGQVTTSNPCQDVSLARTEYLPEDDRLAIEVATEPTDEVCVSCVGLVAFEGTVTFEGGLPGAATVSHGDTFLTGDEPASPGGSQPETVELVEQSFEVTGTGSGSPGDSADVDFDEETSTVTVTGTIVGSDGCTTATLGGASYDPGTDSLAVDVVTTAKEGSERKLCTQALVGIGYEATFTFEGGIPSSVSVSHDGEGVVSAGYGSASASAPDDR